MRLFGDGTRRVGQGLLLAVAMAMPVSAAMPSTAMAVVNPDDVLAGKTFAERGIDAGMAPDIMAPRATLIDTEGNVYFQRHDTEECKIASTTKIMTALVAIEQGNPEQVVTVTDRDTVIGSTANLMAGDTLTLDDALHGLLLPSGNDAAMAIARSVGAQFAPAGQDPYDAFVARMNARAQEMGLQNTLFVNPSGLDYEEWNGPHHSTAADLAKLATEAMKNEQFRKIVATKNYVIHPYNNNVPRDVALESTNLLLGTNEGILGVKTGQTDQAGSCFVGAWEYDGKTYISVILGEQSKEVAFAETTVLFQWVVNHEHTYQLGENDGTTTDDGRPIIAEIPHTDWIDVLVPLTVKDPAEKTHAFDLNGEVKQTAHLETAKGDIHAGDVLGAIELKQGDEVIDSIDLIAAEDVPAPSWLRSVFIAIDRFFRNITGQPIEAETKGHFPESGNGSPAGNKSGDNGTGSGQQGTGGSGSPSSSGSSGSASTTGSSSSGGTTASS